MKRLFKVIERLNLPLPVIGFLLLTFNSCTFPDPGPIQYLDIPEGRMAYQLSGKGEPLIMCMGYSANMDLWDPRLIAELRKKYQVITFDHRGMGLSTNQKTAFTIRTLADDVELLRAHLGLEKVHMMGWSMGGYVAQSYAVHYSERINKLILHATDHGDTTVVDPSQEVTNILSDTSASPMQLMSIMFPAQWLASQSNPGLLFQHAKTPMNGHTIVLQDQAISKWLSPGGGTMGKLYTIKIPTLVITGDQDMVVPHQNSLALMDSLYQSSMIMINNGGHGVMFQCPELLANYILNFLDQPQNLP